MERLELPLLFALDWTVLKDKSLAFFWNGAAFGTVACLLASGEISKTVAGFWFEVLDAWKDYVEEK